MNYLTDPTFDVAKAITDITVENFGLHGQGEGSYKGAPLYTREALAACWRLAEQISAESPAYSRLFSTKYIARLVQDVVTDTARRGHVSNIAAMVDRMFSRLTNPDQKKRCYIPISGVEFEGTLDIGPFRIKWMDDRSTEDAIRFVQKAIGRTKNSARHKELEKRRIRREINETLRQRPCFVHDDHGDTYKVEQEAWHTLSILFDLLRYSVRADAEGRNKRKNIVIGLPVEGRPGAYERYIVPLGKSDASYGGGWSPTAKLRLDDSQVRFMKRIGVFKIAETLKGSGSEFEADLLNAIHWFSQSQTQPTAERELVDLIISAESVVAREPGKTLGVTNKLCEAVAVLLRTDRAEREELFDFIQRICEVRGRVVHEGMTGTDQNDYLRHVVQEFIAAAIVRIGEFKTRFELLKWIETQKTGLVHRAEQRRKRLKRASSQHPATLAICPV